MTTQRTLAESPLVACIAFLTTADALRFALRFASGHEGAFAELSWTILAGHGLSLVGNAAFALLVICAMGWASSAARKVGWLPLALSGAFLAALYLGSGRGIQGKLGVIGAPSFVFAVLAAATTTVYRFVPRPNIERAGWKGALIIGAIVLLVLDRHVLRGLYLPIHFAWVASSLACVALATDASPSVPFRRLAAATFVSTVCIVAVTPLRSEAPRPLAQASLQSSGMLQLSRMEYAVSSLLRPPTVREQTLTRSDRLIWNKPAVPHVVVISIDGLRTDHSLESEKNLTPALNRFADEGLSFTRAYSPASNTMDSLSRMFAGPNDCAEGPEKTMFAQAATAGFHAHCDFPYAQTQLACFSEPCAVVTDLRDRDLVFDSVLQSLTTSAKPVFAFVHLLETHVPYVGFDTAFAEANPDLDKYELSVKAMDAAVEAFVVRARAQADRDILWVFVSDHGESRGERGFKGHDSNTYAEQTWVPLVVWRGTAKGHVATPVSTAWLGASLLDPFVPTGRTNLPVADEQRTAVSVNGTWKSVARDGWRLVTDEASGRTELFDISRDPKETRDLADTNPDVVDRLRAERN